MNPKACPFRRRDLEVGRCPTFSLAREERRFRSANSQRRSNQQSRPHSDDKRLTQRNKLHLRASRNLKTMTLPPSKSRMETRSTGPKTTMTWWALWAWQARPLAWPGPSFLSGLSSTSCVQVCFRLILYYWDYRKLCWNLLLSPIAPKYQ